jgi:hypothetical protein
LIFGEFSLLSSCRFSLLIIYQLYSWQRFSLILWNASSISWPYFLLSKISTKHIKKCSTSLAVKGTANQNHLRFCLTPVRMGIIKNTNKNKFWSV